MPRPLHPLPPQIRNLQYNPTVNRYVITENGITYSMNLEHTRMIKDFYRDDSAATITAWFEKLDNKTKKEVYREGITQIKEFYHDGEAIE